MSEMSEVFDRLQAPFAEMDIEWTVTWTYLPPDGDPYYDSMIAVAPYIKRESILTRLDTVVGPGGWWNEVRPYNDALYHAIAIRSGDQVVTKWDGAAISPSDRNERIDPIKSVSTQSFRRAAEVLGIGRYVKAMPDLFALKREASDYEAKEKTRITPKGGKPVNVRWDPPAIPLEFLPDYMTPEQYVLLGRLARYAGEKKREAIQKYLDGWVEDRSSTSYTDAVEKIAAFYNAIQVPGVREAKTVSSREPAPPPQKKSPPPPPSDSTGHPPPGSPPSTSPAPAPQAPSASGSGQKDQAYLDYARQVYRKAKYLGQVDPTGVHSLGLDLPEIEKAIKGIESSSIELGTLQVWDHKLDSALVSVKADDDLPF